MSQYGELIKALGALKNVKEKRHCIKTLASYCADVRYSERIINMGGWRQAILPLLNSLDEDCRIYAALAIANCSTSSKTHAALMQDQVLDNLVPVLFSEEVSEVVVYVLNALGNLACSAITWEFFLRLNVVDTAVKILVEAKKEEEQKKLNCLFLLSNLTADQKHRSMMILKEVHEMVWGHLKSESEQILFYALATLRGLSVEPQAQEEFPRKGLIPLLTGIFMSDGRGAQSLKNLALGILLHISFLQKNAELLLAQAVSAIIQSALKSIGHDDTLKVGVAIVANMCENLEMHDRIVESPLFDAFTGVIEYDNTQVQRHVIRGLMQLSLSPKYHHKILATSAMANVCPIAMTERLPPEMRTNALELMGAICATHPTTPTDHDIVDLLFLVCNGNEHIEIRRAGMFVLANASADASNAPTMLKKPYIKALVIALSEIVDMVLMDYMAQFFHNLCKMDANAGPLLIECGYQNQMFTYERLEALSLSSAIYVCDTCRQLAQDENVRMQLMHSMLIGSMSEAWISLLEEPKLAPHLALMCSAFTFHVDTHQEFVLQGGVRLICELYTRAKLEHEHVRLCSILTILYLAESDVAQRSIAQERGLQLLIAACENESMEGEAELVTNALKALIPFATSDDYRPQLGMDGAIDTFSSFLFSDKLSLQQLGIYLLQNLLELKINRRIFLGLADEKKCEEDYLEPLTKFLPIVSKGAPKRIAGLRKDKAAKHHKIDTQAADQEFFLSPHDPFMLRCVIHSLALLSIEHNVDVHQRFIDLQVAPTMFNLFYSQQVDQSSGEAIILFFANILHSTKKSQALIMKNCDVMPMLLASRELGFAPHTINRCSSALLAIARNPDFRIRLLPHLGILMESVTATLNSEKRDEDFYSAAALHSALLCELVRIPSAHHEKLADAGILEQFFIFLTIAGKGLKDEMCLELLMTSVYGIAALVGSTTCGDRFMKSLLYPATRIQIFLSLLRLPQLDLSGAFHQGSVGLRTLQRNAAPDLLTEELHVDNLEVEPFIDRCGIRPADFIYRQVIRVLCLLLSHAEMSSRVQVAISPQNIVPTCLFGVQYLTDPYIQVFGYLLLACFSCQPALQHSFVSNTELINEVLTCCRRLTPDSMQEGAQESASTELAKMAMGRPWTSHSVAMNKYLLTMISLASISESIKETYREERVIEDGKREEEQLTFSNRTFITKFTALCLRDLDTDELMATRMISSVQEFICMLRVVIIHNSFMARIDLEDRTKGGQVQLDLTKVKKPEGLAAIPLELRTQFKSLRSVQTKCKGMIQVVDKCLAMNAAKPLVMGLMECLGGISFLSPQSLGKPGVVFRLFKHSPEWLHNTISRLFVNATADTTWGEEDAQQEEIEKEDEDPIIDPDSLRGMETDHVFPFLAVSEIETRQQMIGAIANISVHKHLWHFVTGSGIIRILKPVPRRAEFLQDFGLILERTRFLANVACRDQSHDRINTEAVIAFLRDVLCHSCLLLHRGVKVRSLHKEQYEHVGITFGEEHAPPLGMRIRWNQPPQITEIVADSPAARLVQGPAIGDEIIEANGVDVTQLQGLNEALIKQIQPMFETRPLHIVLRRKMKPEPQPGSMLSAGEDEIDKVDHTDAYGNPELYLECFHLCLLALHNLATSAKTHTNLLAEPKILNVLVDLVPSEVISPSLRRLVFSALTCFAQHKDIAGRIFHQMSDYFMSCQHPDQSLQKYIMLAANLYYTSLASKEVKPDRGMLVFIGRISALENALEANTALVEILHGMARGPKDLRRSFVCRETMVITTEFMQLEDQWDVQARAFEVAFMLTNGTCNPTLWASLEVIQLMARAASSLAHRAEAAPEFPELLKRADALWEITVRTAHLSLQHDILRRTMALPELDRYLMSLLVDSTKPANLVQCAGHLMSGLLQSDAAGSTWQRWRSMGISDKVAQWFAGYRSKQSTDSDKMARDLDSILHLLLFGLELDSNMFGPLCQENAMSSIAHRLLSLVTFYQKNQRLASETDEFGDDDLDEELAYSNSSFRIITQLLAMVAANDQGLAAMSRLGLELPLVSLLDLTAQDLHVPSLLILCNMCGKKQACASLTRDDRFMSLLQKVEHGLLSGAALLPEEIEYYTCILDRSCCFEDLCQTVRNQKFHLLCLLPPLAPTADARLMGIRALCCCGFIDQTCLEALPQTGLACLHYMMALNACLRGETADSAAGSSLVSRKSLITNVGEMAMSNPQEMRLVVHYARAALCLAVASSRSVCRSAFEDLDPLNMVLDLTESFRVAVHRVTDGSARMDLTAAELLNKVTCVLHVLLCTVFRQNTPDGDLAVDEAETAQSTLQALERTLSAACSCLHLDGRGDPESKSVNLGNMLIDDLRVLYALTALLREICAKPLESPFLQVARSRVFYTVLGACIRVANKRLLREVQGPPPKDICASVQKRGVNVAPWLMHPEGLTLAHVFEHLIVCMRYSLVQAMYIPIPNADGFEQPWCLEQQGELDIHKEALSWMPEVLRRYDDTPAIGKEMLRYFCAAATFRMSPNAISQKDSGLVSTAATTEITEIFSLSEPQLLEILAQVLENSTDPCSTCLACLTVANLVEYQRQSADVEGSLTETMLDGLSRIVAALAGVLKEMSKAPREIAYDNTLYIIRAVGSLLSFDMTSITCRIMETDIFAAVRTIFDHFFLDVFKLSNEEDFVMMLQYFVQFVRNWISAGCGADAELRSSQVNRFAAKSTEAKMLDSQLNPGIILDLITSMVMKLTDTPRTLSKLDETLDCVLSEVLPALQTLLMHHKIVDWQEVQVHYFESTLEKIREYRFKRIGAFEDEDMVNVLYLITKLAFQYKHSHLPDYLMQVAYGQREGGHTFMKDIATVCCAIISTQNAKTKMGSATVNVAKVVKNNADFVLSVAKVPDPKMQLWHYRIITQWSQRPKVLDEVSNHKDALDFVVTSLRSPILGRYSIVFIHNISVLRWQSLLRASGALEAMCKKYRELCPGCQQEGIGDMDEPQRRHLRRLLIASIRNCLQAAKPLDTDLMDGDLAAIIELVGDIEAPDVPIYLAAILHLVSRCPAERITNVVPVSQPLVELLAKNMLEQAAAGPLVFDTEVESGLYDFAPTFTQEEKHHQEHDEEEEEDENGDKVAPLEGTNTNSGTGNPFGVTERVLDKPSTRMGLGKKASLYQRKRQDAQTKRTGTVSKSTGTTMVSAARSVGAADTRSPEQEYMYFAVIEILTQSTFRKPDKRSDVTNPAGFDSQDVADDESEATQESKAPSSSQDSRIEDSLNVAFGKFSIGTWLTALQAQVELHERRRITLTDIFMHASAKFMWHCWCNPIFRPLINTPANQKALADLMPFFLSWPHEDVKFLAAETLLYASLHQFTNVCEFLATNHKLFPELASAVLSNALADADTAMRLSQASQYMSVFIALLKSRNLSRSGLHRLIVGFETSLLMDHPQGVCANLVQREHALLGDLLEEMHTYNESGFVKQCMVVTLARTAGVSYKAIPDLDKFVLRVLDLVAPLLESERWFVLAMPVLHRLASAGGRRVQGPLLARHLHMRVARILERDVAVVEKLQSGKEVTMKLSPTSEDSFGRDDQLEVTVKTGGNLSPRERIQWCLSLFCALANGGQREPGSERGSGANLHFETFICVDLLPSLVRLLRTGPGTYEALCISFLLGSVTESPSLQPHLPDIMKFSERAFAIVVHPEAYAAAQEKEKNNSEWGTFNLIAEAGWQFLCLHPPGRVLSAMRRNLIHLFVTAGFLPQSNAGLLVSTPVFRFFVGLQTDASVFPDPVAPLHGKLFALAHLCAHPDNRDILIELGILDVLRVAQEQIVDENNEPCCDLRVLWMHSIVSLACKAGAALLSSPVGVNIVLCALSFAEAILQESQQVHAARGLGIALECQQALAAGVVQLCARVDFGPLRPRYTLYLLSLICSGPLLSLRLAAADHLIEVLTKGQQPEVAGGILLQTPCVQSFERIICGPMDDLASSCARLMMAFVEAGGYDAHVHLLVCMKTVIAKLGDPTCTAERVMALAEFFVVLSTQRTTEVLNAVMELKDITAFLGLARSVQPTRRELVQKWLEAFGSSLYEIDEVMEVFQASTTRGLLHLAARSTRKPEEAYLLRRVMFGLIYQRIQTWRASFFGVDEYVTEELIKAMIPMCEMQPDLVAAIVSLFHAFKTHGELRILDRVWKGGHFQWLCKRMSHKSRAQLAAMQAPGAKPLAAHKGWEKHADLIAMHGMVLRILWQLYDTYPSELTDKAVQSDCVVKNWRELVTFFCHHPWPLRDNREVDDATDANIMFAMKFAKRLVCDVNATMQVKLLAQGMFGVCCTLLLPNPEVQEARRINILEDEPSGDSMDAEEVLALPLPYAKMYAGSIAEVFLHLPDLQRWFHERRNTSLSVAMFSQLHYWHQALMEQQGTGVLATVTLAERCATLFLTLVSSMHLGWCLNHLGLACMGVFCTSFLEIWSQHANVVMRHHALRIFTSLTQAHPLYVSILAYDHKAELVSQAVHRTFGNRDVRELRYLVRFFLAAMVHSLDLDSLPQHVSTIVDRALDTEQCDSLRQLLREGGPLRAKTTTAKSLLLTSYIVQVLEWCERSGDSFARTWSLWIVLTMLAHEEPPSERTTGSKTPSHGKPKDETILVLQAEVSKANLSRRAKFLLNQDGTQSSQATASQTLTFGKEGLPPRCKVEWLRGSQQINTWLANMAGNCLPSLWTESMTLGCVASVQFLMNLPNFLHSIPLSLDGKHVVQCLEQPHKILNLAALLLTAVLASLRLPLRAQTLTSEFLTHFHDLQEKVIEGLASCGDGPYDLVARWLHQPPESLPCEDDFRCLIAFMIGQCILPPLAIAPSLDIDLPPTPLHNGKKETLEDQNATPPTVAECAPPPQALLNVLARETLKEDIRLKEATGENPKPVFSTMLCHLLYSLAVMVPLHAKAAAHSSVVRGAAFTQLMKVQNIVAKSVQSRSLYDTGDGKRAKLFLYIRATACIRMALQCIMGSWFAAEFGARFAVNEEGGRDFIQYCTRHINQVYNNKVALTRVIGTPWERLMLAQGPTSTIAELLLVVCSSDSNLLEVSKLGGEQALHSLCRYGESSQVRSQATMLLTKLAVLQQV